MHYVTSQAKIIQHDCSVTGYWPLLWLLLNEKGNCSASACLHFPYSTHANVLWINKNMTSTCFSMLFHFNLEFIFKAHSYSSSSTVINLSQWDIIYIYILYAIYIYSDFLKYISPHNSYCYKKKTQPRRGWVTLQKLTTQPKASGGEQTQFTHTPGVVV